MGGRGGVGALEGQDRNDRSCTQTVVSVGARGRVVKGGVEEDILYRPFLTLGRLPEGNVFGAGGVGSGIADRRCCADVGGGGD